VRLELKTTETADDMVLIVMTSQLRTSGQFSCQTSVTGHMNKPISALGRVTSVWPVVVRLLKQLFGRRIGLHDPATPNKIQISLLSAHK